MNLVEYWKKRCELAEVYIEESPCDPDIYKEQLDAWNNWCEFKKLHIPDVMPRISHFVSEIGQEYQADEAVNPLWLEIKDGNLQFYEIGYDFEKIYLTPVYVT